MFLWGSLTLAFLGVQSYGAIVALRVLLGIIEAGFYPVRPPRLPKLLQKLH